MSDKVHVIAVLVTINTLDDVLVAEVQIGHKFLTGVEFEPIFNHVLLGDTLFLTCVSAHQCEMAAKHA